jgi:hypothetical protein
MTWWKGYSKEDLEKVVKLPFKDTPQEQLLNTGQVCALAGVKRSTLNRWAREKLIPGPSAAGTWLPSVVGRVRYLLEAREKKIRPADAAEIADLKMFSHYEGEVLVTLMLEDEGALLNLTQRSGEKWAIFLSDRALVWARNVLNSKPLLARVGNEKAPEENESPGA